MIEGGLKTKKKNKKSKPGQYLKRADYIYFKKAGKPQKTMKELSDNLLAKISSYVPSAYDWKNKGK